MTEETYYRLRQMSDDLMRTIQNDLYKEIMESEVTQMEKTYTQIQDSEYDVQKHGAIDAIRIYIDSAELNAEIKTAFRYIFTTNWTGIEKYRFLTAGGGFSGFTYFYDERPLKPKWEDI